MRILKILGIISFALIFSILITLTIKTCADVMDNGQEKLLNFAKEEQERVSRLYYNPQDYKIRVGSEDGKTICYTVDFPDGESLDFLTKQQLDSILLGY